MKNTIYILILILMLSCNKRANKNEINLSKTELIKSLKDTLQKSGVLDSKSKESFKKDLKANSDTTLVITTNRALEIDKQLNGTWYAIEIDPNKPDNIVGFIYAFDAKNKTLESHDIDGLRGLYTYEIVNNCEKNKNTNSYSLKLSGDGNYCSKIENINNKNGKTYLVLKEFITDDFHKEFLKISDDPKFFPKEFK